MPQFMTLWEIAHRWHNVIPSDLDNSSVTPDVRDTLLALIEEILMGHITLGECTMAREIKNGIEYPACLEWMPVQQLPAELVEMYSSGVLRREALHSYGLSLKTVFDWCNWREYEVPEFSVPAWVYAESPGGKTLRTSKPRPEAEDRSKCQEIAARKWAENPSIRIAEMARDEDIRREGNGALYRESTLLSWLREIAPATVKGKPGRPRREENTPSK